VTYLERDGARIYYETHGEGPALVFAHGLGGNHMSWWQQVPVFAQRYRCLAFAHRGFAPSTTEGGPSVVAFADDLEAILDAEGIGQAVFVAQSMGGWTCIEFALRHPERVRAMILCDTTGTILLPAFADIYRAQPRGREQGLFERGIHPAAGERMAQEQPALHHLYWQINNLASGVDKDALRANLGETRNRGIEAVERLTMPVLCIAGEEDIVIPPETVRLLAEALPNGRFVPVPKAGHSVYFERAAEFNAAVSQFLTELENTPGGGK